MTIYVRYLATGTGDGSSWANAYTSLSAGLSAAVAATTTPPTPVWVAEDHSESAGSALSYTGAATQAASIPILCVNHTTGALASSATIATTGAFAISFAGFASCDGVAFTAGAGAVNANIQIGSSTTVCGWRFFNSKMILGGSGSTSTLTVGFSGAVGNNISFYNTTVQFGNVANSIQLYGALFSWKGTPSAIQGSVIPTNLFSFTRTAFLSVEGVDFSAVPSGKNLIGGTLTQSFKADFKDCTLAAGVGIVNSGTAIPVGSRVTLTRCSNSAGNFVEQIYGLDGTQVDSTSVILTGGATDGTTPKSRQITTTNSVSFQGPFETNPISIWNDTAGSPITVSLEGLWNGSTAPNNDDIWIEVEELGASGNPLGSFATSTKASPLAANAVIPTSTATWSGLSGTVTAFKSLFDNYG